MILHFSCFFPSILEINNNFFEVLDTSCLEFSEFKMLTIKVSYKADVSNVYAPFVFCLKLKNNNLSCNNNLVKIFNIKKDEYFLTIMPLVRDNSILYENKPLVIKNGTQVYYNNTLVFSKSFCAINCSFKSFAGLNFYVLNSLENGLLLIINNGKVLLEAFVDKIEYNNENSFTILTNLNDSFKHGIVRTYEINEEKLSLVNEYSVYLNSPPKMFNKNLIVHNFLECGRALNINLAKSFLSNTLKENFSIDSFKKFFKNFNNFYLLSSNEKESEVLLVYDIGCQKFRFYVENNKICNIEN